ncbi:MAG: hypothetical protein Q7J85_11225, partial [Bacillota bacterium]|nr:hypothetical protein [Bacillota bacterium]
KGNISVKILTSFAEISDIRLPNSLTLVAENPYFGLPFFLTFALPVPLHNYQSLDRKETDWGKKILPLFPFFLLFC